MTFEEWWTQRETAAFNSLAGEDNAKAAWDYQQQRIDELEKQLQKVEQAGFYWMNKAQEQE